MQQTIVLFDHPELMSHLVSCYSLKPCPTITDHNSNQKNNHIHKNKLFPNSKFVGTNLINALQSKYRGLWLLLNTVNTIQFCILVYNSYSLKTKLQYLTQPLSSTESNWVFLKRDPLFNIGWRGFYYLVVLFQRGESGNNCCPDIVSRIIPCHRLKSIFIRCLLLNQYDENGFLIV